MSANLRLVKEHGEIGTDAFNGQGDPSFYGSSVDEYAFDGPADIALAEAREQFADAEVVQMRGADRIVVMRF